MAITDREKISEITQSVYSGALANKIKKNASYTIMGVIIGGVVGAMAAGFFGQKKLMGAAVGAAVVGLGGYAFSNKSIKND